MKLYFYLFSMILLLTGIQDKQHKLSLKTIAEEAMSKAVLGKDPIIVGNPYSAKIYSKIDLRHPFWNNLKREDVIIIPKNTELVEKLWGKQARENGVIVYRAAQENKYDTKKLKYVLNGKEINRKVAEKMDTKDIKSMIVIKDRNSEECVVFMSTSQE